MRGTDEARGSLFSYVDLEERIPARHPLRKIRQIVNDALASLDGDFDVLYSAKGRPSIAPERLLRTSLIQILFSVRSERQPLGTASLRIRSRATASCEIGTRWTRRCFV